MRLAEAYLNRAEAYARLNQPTEAVRDMTDLLSKRYLRSSGFDIPEETEELLDFIQKERRKELCYEEHHRWFDLRRTTRPRIEKVIDGKTYILEKDDARYTLRIPQAAIDANPELQH